LSGIALCFGILFKIMHWPLANILMNIGGFSLLLIFLPIYLFNGYKTKQLKTTTIVPVVIAIAGFSLMFSLVKLRNSTEVTIAQHNIQYNLDNENEALTSYNKKLLNTVNLEQLAEEDKKSLQLGLKKTTELTTYIDNLMITSFQTVNPKGLTKEAAKKTLAKNYAGLGNSKMDLNVVRGKTAENENLETLMLKVTEFENDLSGIFGTADNFVYNKRNFETYIKKENSLFPVGIVLQDLTTLKLQVQQSQTLLLTYYKGKVS
ncbi:MAG: hypothetical protein ACPGSL_04485, partial [Vicingaceae bacterium]